MILIEQVPHRGRVFAYNPLGEEIEHPEPQVGRVDGCHFVCLVKLIVKIETKRNAAWSDDR